MLPYWLSNYQSRTYLFFAEEALVLQWGQVDVKQTAQVLRNKHFNVIWTEEEGYAV